MNPSLVLRPLALVALLATALSAQATVLDFEDLVKDPSSGPTFSVYSRNPMTTRGYSLTVPRPYFAAWTPASLTDPETSKSANYTGSVALIMGVPGTTTLTQTGGGAFNLLSIDLANVDRQSHTAGGAAVQFIGYLSTGGTITQSFILASDDALHTFALSGFSNLSSVSLVQSNSFARIYQFDNIAVMPVPEPATLATLGLGAVGLIRKRRK